MADDVNSPVDLERANAARMYDYLLGGAHNFEVDRTQADLALSGHPSLRHLARENRAYLRRLVLWCLEQGVDQFLDLGSGVPTSATSTRSRTRWTRTPAWPTSTSSPSPSPTPPRSSAGSPPIG